MNIASEATALDWRSIGQFPGQLIDQFPMAAVVVNCPPFRGAMTACHPHQLIHRARQPPCRCRNKPRPAPAGAALTFFVPVKRWRGLTDDPPRCSRTFAHVRCNDYTFSSCAQLSAETITPTSAISQRLSLYIRIIKSKRQRTVTPSQPSPSADKSLLVFNPLGIERTETDWERNTGG